MENYAPEWWNKGELADIVRRSRLVTVEANGVYLASIECRHRAAVLRDEALLRSSKEFVNVTTRRFATVLADRSATAGQ
jgi:hypothetical protein